MNSISAGKAILGTAARVGAAGALAGTVSEAALHASQATRTGEESLFAIGGSATLSGVLGSVIGAAVPAVARRELSARIFRDLNADPATTGELADPADAVRQWLADVKSGYAGGPAPGDTGSAATRKQTIDDLTIAGRAAKQVAESTALLNPGLRLFTYESPVARELAEKLGEWTLYSMARGNGARRGREAVRLGPL